MQTQSIRTGNLLGGILLIAGCCIGAGMLGLPVLSAMAGFTPSIVMFFLCWLFMVVTGLLLLEVNLWFGEDISIVTMASRTLGPVGKAVSWFVFLFLFYSLMVAYVAASGSLVTDFIQQLTSFSWPSWVGSLLFTLLFGVLIYRGTGAVDRFNRLLMGGLVLAYVALVAVGAPHVDVQLLKHQDWSAATLVIPAIIVSFGFHNLVPSLTNYLNGNVKALKWAIVIGSAIPLAIYLVWEWLILGLVPLEGENGFKAALDHGEMATQALKSAVGSSWILDVAQAFAFFAIITSFLSVALSFVDFLADGLKIKKTAKGKILLCALALAPPFVFSLIYPTVFLMALNYAGGFGAVILFGILPALMVWKGRYSQKLNWVRIVPGGKPLLVGVILFAVWVMSLQVV
jgi:tyrosine-specific transport protein